MRAFADSSALVKLYSYESGSDLVRALDSIVVSEVARVEVVAAIWRKQRIGEIRIAEAGAMTEQFEDDWRSTEAGESRFITVPLTADVLSRAAKLAASPGLRAYDAVQLSSAIVAREADVALQTFACFDRSLRAAAAKSGLALFPAD